MRLRPEGGTESLGANANRGMLETKKTETVGSIAPSKRSKRAQPDMLRPRNPLRTRLSMARSPFCLGQNSQYLNMGLDLAEAYPIVAETFAEANRVLEPTLGRPLTDFIRWDSSGDDKAERGDLLRQTEYSQPATLTLDIAIYRLLAARCAARSRHEPLSR